MKKIIITILLSVTVLSLQAQQRQISYIKDDGGYYLVYDENGKKISAVSKMTIGEVVGWGIDFFVSLDGSWYKIYDSSGKKEIISRAKIISTTGRAFVFTQS